MGALYLQDAICLLPARPDLTENLLYVAQAVEEMGGSCHVFAAASLLPHGAEVLTAGFRELADQRLSEVAERIDTVVVELRTTLGKAGPPPPAELVRAESELKRERVAYLRARKLSYCGASPEQQAAVEEKLDLFRKSLDNLGHGAERGTYEEGT